MDPGNSTPVHLRPLVYSECRKAKFHAQSTIGTPVTAAGAQARLPTLAGLTATYIAHSVHSKVSAEALPLL